MKILYTGPCRPASLTEARRRALLDLGHEVTALDQTAYIDRGSYLMRRVHRHLLVGPAIARYNRDLARAVAECRPDLLYVDQAGYLWPSTVARLSATVTRLVHYTSEFVGCRRYWYRHLKRAVGRYDAHVITNRLNVAWLRRHGARKIVMTEFGYDPVLHRPPTVTAEERPRYAIDVLFVGHWEPVTETRVVALRRAGMQVRVWGSGWWRSRLVDRREIGPLHGEEYVKAVAGARVALGLLSKWNRNESASRSFEIPAIGAFLLAERTSDHRRYYDEGAEAEFFDSTEEMVDKARYYLDHDEERVAIAEAGHRRCLKSPYRHEDRMRELLAAL